jgi:gas vesicle protein
MAQEDNRSMLKGLVIGMVAGGAVGAVVALLFAPKSGKELRADIRDKAGNLLEGADDYLRAAKTQAGQIVSEAKTRSNQLIDDAKKKADTLIHDADRVLADVRQKSGTAAEEGARLKNAVRAGVDAFKEERRKG